ncbi:MAG TPA: AAA family ATPase [Paludibacter sp.]|nr:AAA family ATPase [Paludibacter sp.]
MYLKRRIDADLATWKDDPRRKPLLLRGARQVGKTRTVRELAKTFDTFVEINFEHRDFQFAKSVFEKHSSPHIICDELSAILGVQITEGKTLLFLDEIQSCIPALSALRYFYEEMPVYMLLRQAPCWNLPYVRFLHLVWEGFVLFICSLCRLMSF